MNTKKPLKRLMVLFAPLALSGCASFGVRADRAYETGTLYPGTSLYLEEAKYLFSNVVSHQGYPKPQRCAGVPAWTLPVLLPDALVLTPALDTVLLPYDTIRALTRDPKKEPQQGVAGDADKRRP